MDAFKTVLLYLGRIVLNLIMVVLAWFFYTNIVRPTTANTVTMDHFQEIVGIVVLMIGLPVLTLPMFKLIRPISFGLVCLFIPVFLYGIFFVNNAGSPNSYQRLFPIETKESINNEMVIGVYVYEKSGRVHYKIPSDNCLELDSIRITIKDGLLGMKIITNDINLSKKPDCGG